MEYRRTSFLAEKAPEAYRFLSELKPVALVYACVLTLATILSLFFQSSLIKFFIDYLMGWTLLSVPFVGVLVVILDKEIDLPQKKWYESEPPKPTSYKRSKIWGIFLLIAGIIALYYSNRYKEYYAFQCQTIYVEQPREIYHLFKACKHIGKDSDGNSIEDYLLIETNGADLLNSNYELCDACREKAEDAGSDYITNQYYRK